MPPSISPPVCTGHWRQHVYVDHLRQTAEDMPVILTLEYHLSDSWSDLVVLVVLMTAAAVDGTALIRRRFERLDSGPSKPSG